MNLILVAVKDRKLDAFIQLYPVRTKGEAIRNFQDSINNDQHRQLFNHAEDFDLYVIGYFDDNTGLLERLDNPEVIGHGDQLKGLPR